MINFSTTAGHALLICIPFTIFAVATFIWRPRLWLHSLPPDIIAMVDPKTAQEKKQTKYLLLPLVILILPGLSICSVLYIIEKSGVHVSMIAILVHLYGIWIIVHLWDFLIIDCIAIILINPLRPPIRGSEGAKGWGDYGFHFRAMLKAILKSALFILPAAFFLSLIF